MKLLILSFCLLTLLPSCLAKKKSLDSASVGKDNRGVVSIMTFNVENLFDTEHDKGKTDYTFLPLTSKKSRQHISGCRKISRKKWRDQCLYWDWNETALREKLLRLAGSIKQVNQGKGPDIIVFQEVENIKVLERLRTEFLQGLGYKKTILVEGRDQRGIDVGFVSKLEAVGKPKLRPVPYKNISARRKQDTRGILEQTFRLPDGELITGFAAHFPAPFHPYKLRIASYKYLNSLQEKLPKGRMSFAAGDFNTPDKENRQHQILDRYVDSHWVVAHEEGCSACPGTNYYAPKKSWSFLDMILISENFSSKTSKWQKSKVYLANRFPEQQSKKGRPNSFKIKNGKIYGVSDHWPLVVEINKVR